MAGGSGNSYTGLSNDSSLAGGAGGGTKEMADDEQPRAFSLVAKCLAEFVGCIIFIFVGTMQASGAGPDGVLHASLAHGICIFILVASLGHISGGHFNPAVTVGVTVVGKINPIHSVAYVISQLAGGFIGSILAKILLGNTGFENISYGLTLCAPGVSWYQGLLAELITTFMLVHTVLLTAVDTDKNVLAPLAIGLTVGIDVLAVGAISGASMNPARSFGPNLVATIFHSSKLPSTVWSQHYIYYLGPVLGAVLAGGLYLVSYSRESRLLK